MASTWSSRECGSPTGHEEVLAALQNNTEYAQYRREHGEQAARQSGLAEAISYRQNREFRKFLKSSHITADCVQSIDKERVDILMTTINTIQDLIQLLRDQPD